MSNQIRCGLCNKWLNCSWNEHEKSKEHQEKIKNLGGVDAIIQRRINTTRLVGVGNPKLVNKLANQVDRKIEKIITGNKSYDITHSDNYNSISGYINNEGEWFSCDTTDHEIFAYDFLEIFENYLIKHNKKRLSNTVKQFRKDKTKSCKDFLVDRLGWVSVTDGLTDIYVISNENGMNHKQKLTLKRWFLKFKKPFRLDGNIINNEFHDFFQE